MADLLDGIRANRQAKADALAIYLAGGGTDSAKIISLQTELINADATLINALNDILGSVAPPRVPGKAVEELNLSISKIQDANKK